jgi:antitoxin (DNA-binding transcriptional repressor) of toxin-antitoxin stability system
MSTVTLQFAKSHLARLIAKAHQGRETDISNGSGLLVRWQPIRSKAKARKPGGMKGPLKIGPGFFEPLPKTEQEGWE